MVLGVSSFCAVCLDLKCLIKYLMYIREYARIMIFVDKGLSLLCHLELELSCKYVIRKPNAFLNSEEWPIGM
jgi:hypothetical protein